MNEGKVDSELIYLAGSRAKQKTVVSAVNNHSIFLSEGE